MTETKQSNKGNVFKFCEAGTLDAMDITLIGDSGFGYTTDRLINMLNEFFSERGITSRMLLEWIMYSIAEEKMTRLNIDKTRVSYADLRVAGRGNSPLMDKIIKDLEKEDVEYNKKEC